jgi:hypothetical protein
MVFLETCRWNYLIVSVPTLFIAVLFGGDWRLVADAEVNLQKKATAFKIRNECNKIFEPQTHNWFKVK